MFFLYVWILLPSGQAYYFHQIEQKIARGTTQTIMGVCPRNMCDQSLSWDHQKIILDQSFCYDMYYMSYQKLQSVSILTTDIKNSTGKTKLLCQKLLTGICDGIFCHNLKFS